jgi:dTDP-4-dehydrorhamnose 3,5-epimerase
MNVIKTELPEVLLLEPKIWRDDRGAFLELWKEPAYAALGIAQGFVQDNLSHSARGTLRGLHFQEPTPQGKLVQVLTGSVFDVVVDVRRGSPRFGRWAGVALDGERAQQLWIPPGFAHGFYVTSEQASFLYKCTALYTPAHERSLRWNDPALAIRWPIVSSTTPLVSPKDAAAPTLAESELLPRYEG